MTGFLAALPGLLQGAGSAASGLSSLLGGQSYNWGALNAQMNFQREMAQNSISWRVKDAQNAGVSPLVALGAPTFSPTLSLPADPVSDPGSGFRHMGQGLGDLVKTLTKEEKAASAAQLVKESQESQSRDLDILERGARIRLLEKQIARPDGASVVPRSGGLAGQSTTKSPAMGEWETKPPEVTNQQPGTNTSEAGPAIADTRWMATPSGVRPFPASKTLDDTDLLNPEYIEWAARNKFFPNKGRAPSPEFMAKQFPGSIGSRWNQWELEWQPVYPKGGRIK
jgi:hypothetical protein